MKTLRTLSITIAVSVLSASAFGQASGKAGAKASPAPKAAVAPDTTVIRGGKLLTMTHGVIENGVVVLDHGKITAVGAAGSVAIPRNAKVIDATGMTVYPGLIDSQTQLGITEISAVDMSNDLAETSDEIMP